MRILKWISGRQGSGYDKFPMLISESLKCDFYLLRFPKGVEVPKHKDPVKPGFKHHRINLTIWGCPERKFRMYVLGKVKRWSRIDYFRPDLYEHGLPVVQSNMYMLSFGWLTKDTQ